MAENEDKNKPGFLREADGSRSLRRLLAFILAIYLMAIGILCIIKAASWAVILVSIGIPALVIVLLLFFTTWNEVSTGITSIAGAIKK